MKKLIMKFVLFKNILLAETIQMPEDLRGKGDLTSITIEDFDFYLKSYSRPTLTNDTLYLPGTFKDGDREVATLTCDSEEEAAFYEHVFKKLVNKINEGR